MTTVAPAPLTGEVEKYLGRELGLVTCTIMGLWTVTVCLGGMAGGGIVDKVGVAMKPCNCMVDTVTLMIMISSVSTGLRKSLKFMKERRRLRRRSSAEIFLERHKKQPITF